MSQQRPAASAIEQDVARVEHRHGVLRRYDGCAAVHRVGRARIDQIAERLLDLIERAEPQGPFAKQCHQVRWYRASEGGALVELSRIEDGLDVLGVEVIGAVALD